MKHVDEGLLHAFLDGTFRPGEVEHTRIAAHLALCGECRAGLEQARQLRDLAEIIVDDLGPCGTITRPAELLPAPGGTRSAVNARRQMRSPHAGWVPLAWAASVLLALGGGWVVGERWPTGERLASSVASGELEVTSPEALHLPDDGPAVVRELTADEPARALNQAEAAPSTPPAPPVPGSPAPAPVLLLEVTPRLAASHEPVLPEQPVRLAVPPTSLSPAETVAPPLPRAAEIDAARAATEARRGRTAAAAERTIAGPLPEAPAGAGSAGPARGGPRPPLGRGAGGVRPSLPTAAARASRPQPESPWRPVLPSEAEAWFGEPLAVVEGLPISGVWIAQEGSAGKVRLTQPLERGGVLELIQWIPEAGGKRELAAPAAEAEEARAPNIAEPRILWSGEAGSGRTTVLLMLRPRGSMLSLTAPLPPEELLELAERVRAGQP